MNTKRPFSPPFALLAAVLGVITFWTIRAYYWTLFTELPFSDMSDFEAIAHRILANFDFSHSEFWKSYKSPTLPVLGAIVFGLFGKGNYLAWQIFQSLMVSIGAVWLAVEVARYSRSAWLGAALLWVIALSKPSIFWSYKFATEGVAEALLYLISANFLFALRRSSALGFLTTGCLVTAAILNRPNYVVLIGFISLFLLAFPRFSVEGRTEHLAFAPRGKWILAFFLGLALLWTPWVVRGYLLYGEILLTNTSGGHSFVFDLGRVTLTEADGTKVSKTNDELITEAATRFSNDYQSHKYAQRFFNEWVSEDPIRYLRVINLRFWETALTHNVYLTKVSRTELFPGPLNSFLLDKSGLVLVLGFIGLLSLISYSSALWILPFAAVTPWLFAIIVANTSRYLDPMLPLIFFGIPCSVWVLAKLFASKHIELNQTTSSVNPAVLRNH